MQEQIDQGAKYCPACERFGVLSFCGACGRRFQDHELERQRCSECDIEVSTEFCPSCGERLMTDFIRDLLRGKADLAAEGRHAAAIRDQMIKDDPKLASDLYPNRRELWPSGVAARTDLVSGLNRAFGAAAAQP